MQAYDNVKEKAAKNVYPDVRLYLLKEIRFFGKGPYELLKLIEQEDSIKAACEKMNISYSKSLRMIKNIESQLGVKIVDRKRGGSSHGQSELTEKGKQLISIYEAFHAKSKEMIDDLFEVYFSDWLAELP